MRILIASPFLPWPSDSGGNAAVLSTLKCLENDHDFIFVYPIYQESDLINGNKLQTQFPKVRFRPVSCRPIGGVTQRVARWAVRRGRKLFEFSDVVSQASYPLSLLPPRFIAALQEEITNGVDICQAEFVDMLSLGPWFPKDIPKVFIHYQVHFIYSKRFMDINGRSSYSEYLHDMWQVHEIAYLRQFNGIITVSEQDRTHLLEWLEPNSVFSSPFPIPIETPVIETVSPNFDGRFIMLGSEGHKPNRDGLEWLITRVWPEITKALPHTRLVVIGKWGDAFKARYSQPKIEFRGFVEDLAVAVQGGIMLVPLRVGSGIRVKIMVAMSQGVPVITTSVGCEGLCVTADRDILIRDDESGFVAAAIQLANDPSLRGNLARAARETVLQNYSQGIVRHRRNQIYSDLLDRSKRLNLVS